MSSKRNVDDVIAKVSTLSGEDQESLLQSVFTHSALNGKAPPLPQDKFTRRLLEQILEFQVCDRRRIVKEIYNALPHLKDVKPVAAFDDDGELIEYRLRKVKVKEGDFSPSDFLKLLNERKNVFGLE